MSKFKVGDRVVNENGEREREIIEIRQVTQYRTSDKYDGSNDQFWMNEEQVENWSLVSDTTELTLDEIASKFNIPVAKLRIKE